MTTRTSLRSMLRQQAVIEGRGSSTFFHTQNLYRGRAQNFSKSQSLGGGSGVEFFQVPESIQDYIEAELEIFPNLCRSV